LLAPTGKPHGVLPCQKRKEEGDPIVNGWTEMEERLFHLGPEDDDDDDWMMDDDDWDDDDLDDDEWDDDDWDDEDWDDEDDDLDDDY
jgi:hypothetical protein